ncbi:MAG: hypothetical protein A2161_02235 [Candidatus Schekmanbacteria bacterium RBG_13_48_7]|uniref:Right handed beta helix domain-containing protein n=1 Tax=Candidatus Schekmanbacteria bacterium RBG_13_48_7 TaxID=1817878 RepID=A0A1F7RSG1_9BACT|nr:MAG: hypothetical protein A2161_02235 [Candidatus Schekmanbacteria bacterium RBG_13_48_7]
MEYVKIAIIKKILTAIFVWGLLLLYPFHSWATNIYVDAKSGDDMDSGLSWSEAKATICSGLWLSNTLSGADTVHVAQGTYNEAITLVEESVLLGGYPSGGGTRNPDIYISKITSRLPIVTGADNAVIDGFTITGGTVSVSISPACAIFCDRTSPTISNNVIEDNKILDFNDINAGAGVYCLNSGAVITNNLIQNNSVTGLEDLPSVPSIYGGGIMCENSTCTIKGNVIKNNMVQGGNTSVTASYGGHAYGGGICCKLSSCLITGNVIDNNQVFGGDGGRLGGYAFGGGIYSNTDVITRNFITSNTISEGFGGAPGYSQGGGIYGGIQIENNLIKSNYGYYGGGICSSGKIANNTISSNDAYSGGGIEVLMDAIVVNNILNDNMSSAISEKSPSGYTKPALVQNNNFYNCGSLYEASGGTYTVITDIEITLTYCKYNITCPPDFKAGSDYRLSGSSCCIDGGTSYLAPSEDLDGNARPFGSGYDIGADEYYASNVPILNNKLLLLFISLVFIFSLIYKIR